MKRLVLPALLALSACAAQPIPAPATVSERTTLDERAAIAAELAYQAAANTMLVTGAAKRPAVKLADVRAYAAVLAVRSAYRAGNAESYLTAARDAQSALASLLTAIKG